jgi:iron complex outermembrane receptor protein
MHNDEYLHRLSLLSVAVAAICSAPGDAVDAQTIDEVLVFGTQAAPESATGSRLNLTVLETPATIDVIDGDAIRARIDTNVLDAVTRSAGFTVEANPGNGHSSIAARGFTGQGSVTKLYDGQNYYTAAGTLTFPFDTWAVERVEVLKGPSSVLYGEGGIGGAINVIPRKPQFDADGSVRVIAGANDTTFLGVDHTAGITESLAYRFDYSRNTSDNWVNDGDSEADMLALALLWEINDDLSLSARYDRGEQEPMRYFGAPAAQGDFLRDFVGLNLNVSDAEIRYEDDALRVRADWSASDTVTVDAEFYSLGSERFWKNAEWYVYDGGSQLVERYDPLILGHDMTHDGLRAKVRLSPSGGRVNALVGAEINDLAFARPSNFGPGNPNALTFDEFDVVDPYDFEPGVLADIATAPFLPDQFVDVDQHAIFSEGQFKLTDRFALVAALRFDDYQTDSVRLGAAPISQGVDATTGRIGAVFDLSDDTAFYAQYGTGAQHNISVITISSLWRDSSMIESEQIEIGVKHQVAGTGFQWNVAVFDIVKNNLTEDNPNSANPADLIFVPEQTSQGVEVGFSYTAAETVQLYGNASVLNAETNTGARPNAVPEETYNVGVAWDLAGAVRVLADARYVGDRFFASNPVPSYTVVDASLRWGATGDVAFTFKVDNLFDELYASGTANGNWLVGKPRTASLAVDFRF